MEKLDVVKIHDASGDAKTLAVYKVPIENIPDKTVLRIANDFPEIMIHYQEKMPVYFATRNPDVFKEDYYKENVSMNPTAAVYSAVPWYASRFYDDDWVVEVYAEDLWAEVVAMHDAEIEATARAKAEREAEAKAERDAEFAERLALVDRLHAAGEKLSYKKATFNISVMRGDKYVPEPRDGYIAVDKATRDPLGFAIYNDGYWVVTHLPTGFRIDNLYPGTRKQALAAIGVLLEIGGDIWSNLATIEDVPPDIYQAVRQFILEVRRLWS